MPNRIIRDAILTSERVASLGWAEEVFYRRLMSIVDDYGRHEASPQLLRARCYPLQTDQVRVADISRWMAACQKSGLILDYAVDGKRYLEIVRFQQQQRSPSKCPAPLASDTSCKQVIANEHLDVVVVVSEDVGDTAPARPKARKRATPLPDCFAVSERVKTWAAEKGYTKLDQHLEAFLGKCRAKGYTYLDWDEAFMNCIREDWGKVNASKVTQMPERHGSHVPARLPEFGPKTEMPQDMKGIFAKLKLGA